MYVMFVCMYVMLCMCVCSVRMYVSVYGVYVCVHAMLCVLCMYVKYVCYALCSIYVCAYL